MDNAQLLYAYWHRVGLYQGYITREFELLLTTSSYKLRARRAWAEGLVQLADLQCKLATSVFTIELAEEAVQKCSHLADLIRELKKLSNTDNDLSYELFIRFVASSYTAANSCCCSCAVPP